jgi:hypothetical protein
MQEAATSAQVHNGVPRSYLINGWNDVLTEKYGNFNGRESMFRFEVKEPSATVVFGEKKTESDHYYMDMLEGVGNDFTELEHNAHGGTGRNSGGEGGANHIFADASAQFFQFPEAIQPINYWAVTKQYRQVGEFLP